MQRIVGPFELTRPIARGGMGVIWEANHTVTQSAVAIKVITSDAGRALSARTLKFRKMFRSEVRATARLNHRNVVNILDYGALPDSIAPLDGLSPGALYYVMPMAEGGALPEYRPHSWTALYSLLTQILKGLAHAHARRVIHRDIKPANILVHGTKNPHFYHHRFWDFLRCGPESMDF